MHFLLIKLIFYCSDGNLCEPNTFVIDCVPSRNTKNGRLWFDHTDKYGCECDYHQLTFSSSCVYYRFSEDRGLDFGWPWPVTLNFMVLYGKMIRFSWKKLIDNHLVYIINEINNDRPNICKLHAQVCWLNENRHWFVLFFILFLFIIWLCFLDYLRLRFVKPKLRNCVYSYSYVVSRMNNISYSDNIYLLFGDKKKTFLKRNKYIDYSLPYMASCINQHLAKAALICSYNNRLTLGDSHITTVGRL